MCLDSLYHRVYKGEGRGVGFIHLVFQSSKHVKKSNLQFLTNILAIVLIEEATQNSSCNNVHDKQYNIINPQFIYQMDPVNEYPSKGNFYFDLRGWGCPQDNMESLHARYSTPKYVENASNNLLLTPKYIFKDEICLQVHRSASDKVGIP